MPEGREWLKSLHDRLRSLGVSFEVEESTRIHIGELVVEVSAVNGEAQVTVSIPLPVGGEDPEYYIKVFSQAVKLITALGDEVEYSLDTSLPSYPTLYASKKYSEPSILVDKLTRVIEEFTRNRRRSLAR